MWIDYNRCKFVTKLRKKIKFLSILLFYKNNYSAIVCLNYLNLENFSTISFVGDKNNLNLCFGWYGFCHFFENSVFFEKMARLAPASHSVRAFSWFDSPEPPGIGVRNRFVKKKVKLFGGKEYDKGGMMQSQKWKFHYFWTHNFHDLPHTVFIGYYLLFRLFWVRYKKKDRGKLNPWSLYRIDFENLCVTLLRMARLAHCCLAGYRLEHHLEVLVLHLGSRNWLVQLHLDLDTFLEPRFDWWHWAHS